MNTVTFHPWPVRTARHRQPRRAAHRPRPAAGPRLPRRRRGGPRAARGAGRDRAHRLGQDLRQPRRARLRAGRAHPRVPRRAARRHRHRPRARAPAARPRHDVVVEGGARRADLRRLQPGLPRPHHRLGLQPAAAAGRAGVDAGDLGRARRRVEPGGLHRAHRARRRSRTRGDAWAGIDDAGRRRRRRRSRCGTADVDERGLGELQLPARLPEDAGRAAARAAEQAPRPTRPTASTWRPRPSATPPGRRGVCRSCRPCRRCSPSRSRTSGLEGEVLLRAEVGRLPLDRLPLRRPRRDRQPQREADDPLLPRGRRGGRWRTCRRSASSTARSSSSRPGGDRLDFDLLQQRIHPAASRVQEAVAGDAGALRRLRPARAGRRGPA